MMSHESKTWDASAFVGNWPFRHLSHATPESLETRLRREGIDRAFVSPLGGLFANDPQPVNEFWGGHLRSFPFFLFVPILNPVLPGWERSLERSLDFPNTVGIRLLPNYHGYSPADVRVEGCLRRVNERGLPLLLQMRMQDVRSMNPSVRVPDVDWRDVLELCRRCPDGRIIIAAAKWQELQMLRPAAEELPHLYFDISHMEYVDGLNRFVNRWGADRLLFGTHAPIFTPTAARLKLEMSRLSPESLRAIRRDNLMALLQHRANSTTTVLT